MLLSFLIFCSDTLQYNKVLCVYFFSDSGDIVILGLQYTKSHKKFSYKGKNIGITHFLVELALYQHIPTALMHLVAVCIK